MPWRFVCCSLAARRAIPCGMRCPARWAGESANRLMLAGQIGGQVLMARHLARRNMRMQDAAAVVTVSTMLQTFAQIAFALLGVALASAQAGGCQFFTELGRLAAWHR